MAEIQYKDYAIRMLKENIDLITPKNGGARPVANARSYFITTEDPTMYNLILSQSDFHRSFEFIEPENEHDFTEIRERRI